MFLFSDGEKSDEGVDVELEPELEPDVSKDSNVTKWVVCSGKLIKSQGCVHCIHRFSTNQVRGAIRILKRKVKLKRKWGVFRDKFNLLLICSPVVSKKISFYFIRLSKLQKKYY